MENFMENYQESTQNIINLLKRWQRIEDESIKNTTEIIKRTDNNLTHVVMEIIRQDSVMHRRVQQMIIDHYEKEPLSINPENLNEIWGMISAHDAIEKETIRLAKEIMDESNSQLVKYLLGYLITDETKHDKLLEELEKIKKGELPYSE
jgi:hypothetical protein